MIEINIDPMATCENRPRDGSGRRLERQNSPPGGGPGVGQNSAEGAWWGLGCRHTTSVRRSQAEMTSKKADVARPSPSWPPGDLSAALIASCFETCFGCQQCKTKVSSSLPYLNASSGHIKLPRQLGTLLSRWERRASICFVQDLELSCIGPLALFLDDGLFGDQHRSRLLSEHTVRDLASSIWGRTMGLDMCRESTLVRIHTHR